MSTMNMCVPPQTYSRLFRPWDTKIETRIETAAAASRMMMKTEYGNSTDDAMDREDIVDIMHSESSDLAHLTDSEDNECSLSNSSGDSSSINPLFDDCESDALSMNTPPPPPSSSSLNASPSASTRNCISFTDGQLRNSNLYTSTAQLFHQHHPHLQQQHHQQQQQHHHQQQSHLSHSPNYSPQLTMFSGLNASSGAEAAAGAAGSNSFYYSAAAAAAAVANSVNMSNILPNFNIDPYPLGLMEQEYARVMAEEAHIKALNARKQRPKKFKCPHCDVAFSNNGQLKGHIRIHTGERPFKCDAEGCGKTFTRNEELTRHKRIHTGLRPFPCPACGKKFGRRDHLKKHMKTHMPQEHPLAGSAAFFMPMYPYMYGL